MGFRLPSILVADAHSSGNAGTYYYEFAYKAPNIGAAVHVSDLFFVFGTLDTSDVTDAMKPGQSETEKSLSESMMGAWVSFARTGNPNHSSLPEWKEYEPERRSMMILNVNSELVSNHLDDKIDLWKSLSLL
jgi:carboxylesterase type B